MSEVMILIKQEDWQDFHIDWYIYANDEREHPTVTNFIATDLKGAANNGESELYCDGSVKWDGCTEMNIEPQHWCGQWFYRRNAELMKHIYETAFVVMNREPYEKWGKFGFDEPDLNTAHKEQAASD